MQTDVTLIRAFCASWGYFYGLTREALDFQSLIDNAFKGVYCFQAQGRINPVTTAATGFMNGKTYTGRLYFGVPSDLDGILNYDKYDNVVLNIDKLDIPAQLVQYLCKEYVIRVSNMQPFYNLFAINYDGISFDYEILISDKSELTEALKREFIANGIFLPVEEGD